MRLPLIFLEKSFSPVSFSAALQNTTKAITFVRFSVKPLVPWTRVTDVPRKYLCLSFLFLFCSCFSINTWRNDPRPRAMREHLGISHFASRGSQTWKLRSLRRSVEGSGSRGEVRDERAIRGPSPIGVVAPALAPAAPRRRDYSVASNL